MSDTNQMATMSPEAKAACAASCEAALETHAGENATAGSAYQLMRYARMGFLAPNPASLSDEDIAHETSFLASLGDLAAVGPLPDFYTFLRKAKAGQYVLAA